MKQLLRLTVEFLALGALAVATGPAQADSPGPYYATPSWDQTLPAATRFIVLSNFAGAAVLDRNTGLVWEKSPATATQDRLHARYNCLNNNVGGQKGWRLPSITELASLIDTANSDPALPSGHPFLVPTGFVLYWSATAAADSDTVWGVHTQDGVIDAFAKDLTGVRAWCVRSGGLLSEY